MTHTCSILRNALVARDGRRLCSTVGDVERLLLPPLRFSSLLQSFGSSFVRGINALVVMNYYILFGLLAPGSSPRQRHLCGEVQNLRRVCNRF